MVIFNRILTVPRNRKLSGFRTKPWKIKQIRIPFCGTKIEAKISKLSEFPSKLFTEEITTRNSFCGTKTEANS